MTSSPNVLPIRPKTIRSLFKQQEFFVEFIPATKLWRWHFSRTISLPYEGESASLEKAISAAKRKITEVVGE